MKWSRLFFNVMILLLCCNIKIYEKKSEEEIVTRALHSRLDDRVRAHICTHLQPNICLCAVCIYLIMHKSTINKYKMCICLFPYSRQWNYEMHFELVQFRNVFCTICMKCYNSNNGHWSGGWNNTGHNRSGRLLVREILHCRYARKITLTSGGEI